MTLSINGEKREGIRAGTVAELVVELGLPAPACLVEHNGVALRRTEWDQAVLGEGDVLEIIRIVAGG
jgi:thiamine biosynthesis protein ThiS